MAREAEIEKHAREEYGEDFSAEFAYRQGDRRGVVMQKSYAIARAYNTLHP